MRLSAEPFQRLFQRQMLRQPDANASRLIVRFNINCRALAHGYLSVKRYAKPDANAWRLISRNQFGVAGVKLR